MSIMDDYKQLQMIENIKNLKEMEMAYKSNLKLCKYQEQQINKLATCIEQIKEIAEVEIECKTYEIENDCFNETRCKALNEHIDFTKQILQKISEVENDNRN